MPLIDVVLALDVVFVTDVGHVSIVTLIDVGYIFAIGNLPPVGHPPAGSPSDIVHVHDDNRVTAALPVHAADAVAAAIPAHAVVPVNIFVPVSDVSASAAWKYSNISTACKYLIYVPCVEILTHCAGSGLKYSSYSAL